MTTQYLIPVICLLAGAMFAGNAWMGFRRGRLYFFEFWEDNQVQRSQDPLLFNIAFFGSMLISLAAIAFGIAFLLHNSR